MPVIPANMECVINEEIALKLAENNYFYIYHRFGNTLDFCMKMSEKNQIISISIGVNYDAYELLFLIKKNNIDIHYITIDIAHGHSIKMEKMLKWLKMNMSDTYIIAGNICTEDAVEDLESWGADAIKVGIGPGSACTTYNTTGFGSRGCQALVVKNCSLARKKNTTVIIADGGIKEPGDIAKAIAIGADIVMIGGMFSGLRDSPGLTVQTGGKLYKEFWGSASSSQSGKESRIEGIKTLVELKSRNFLEEMAYLHECLQSAISYGGGKEVYCLRDCDIV
jgi:GMP reductase